MVGYNLILKKKTKGTGFLPEERNWMHSLLGNPEDTTSENKATPTFVDSLRTIYKDTPNLYTWWDPKTFRRSENLGWRLDYAIVSAGFSSDIEDAGILKYVLL